MRFLIIALSALLSSVSFAEKDLRTGPPKDCYLYSWGKGPNWIAEVPDEFRLGLLNRRMPDVDDGYSEPTAEAFRWIDLKVAPKVKTVASVEGRKVIEVVYPEEGAFGKTIGTIVLAIETAPDSGWFSPFFAARPELFSSRFVSGKDVAFGYVASLEFSGTGAARSHRLFDLRKPHPVLVGTLESGRVVRNEFDTDEEYEQALKIFDREKDLLSGIINPAR